MILHVFWRFHIIRTSNMRIRIKFHKLFAQSSYVYHTSEIISWTEPVVDRTFYLWVFVDLVATIEYGLWIMYRTSNLKITSCVWVQTHSGWSCCFLEQDTLPFMHSTFDSRNGFEGVSINLMLPTQSNWSKFCLNSVCLHQHVCLWIFMSTLLLKYA